MEVFLYIMLMWLILGWPMVFSEKIRFMYFPVLVGLIMAAGVEAEGGFIIHSIHSIFGYVVCFSLLMIVSIGTSYSLCEDDESAVGFVLFSLFYLAGLFIVWGVLTVNVMFWGGS